MLEQTVAEMSESVVLRYGSLYGPGAWYARNELFAEPIRRSERGASNAKARRQLGWQPRFPSWREGFKYTLG